jgi:hypothetical protein
LRTWVGVRARARARVRARVRVRVRVRVGVGVRVRVGVGVRVRVRVRVRIRHLLQDDLDAALGRALVERGVQHVVTQLQVLELRGGLRTVGVREDDHPLLLARPG